jgi:hypothetical protein
MGSGCEGESEGGEKLAHVTEPLFNRICPTRHFRPIRHHLDIPIAATNCR